MKRNVLVAAIVFCFMAAWFLYPEQVLASGSPPVVDIDGGVNKVIALPAKDLTLFGHAVDPEFDHLAVQWTQTSGPAAVTFSAPWALTTTVTFTTPGTYTFSLAVSDGTNFVTSSNSVTVLSAASQKAFYVDPTYTGGSNDGSALHPWLTLHASNPTTSTIWNTINAALATNNVIIYFSARQAGSDTPEIETREIDIWRTDASAHRFTLDGMSKYNTNDATPSWVDYSGTTRFRIAIASDSLSIGVQGPNTGYPMNYTTIRGFDVSGATGRVLIAGNYAVVEYTHVHDIFGNGANIMVQPSVKDYPNCSALFGNLHDITIRGNSVDHGFGEGIYVSGTYFKAAQGGCLNWGNTHRDILIEGNSVDQTISNGGESDDVDLKAGLTNVTVRNNDLYGGAFGTRGIVTTGVFPDPDGTPNTRTNFLMENNRIHDRAGRGIDMQNHNGTIIRNNVIYNVATLGVNVASPAGEVWPYTISNRVELYNNTIYNTPAPFASSDSTLAVFKNNLVAGAAVTLGSTQLLKSSNGTQTSDYNILVQGGKLIGGWVEGPNSITLPATTSFFVDAANNNFHLTSNSPAVNVGADLSSTGFSTDIVGITRPQGPGWDIGAYEYSSSSDAISPTVSITSPTGGAVSGVISITANAADNVGVVGVQFKLDGGILGGEVKTPPYSVTWDTSTAASGAHTLTAVARDAAGNSTTSLAVNVTMSNGVDSVAPVVSITSPGNGSSVSGAIAVNANASDNVGVVGVQFKLDGALLGNEDAFGPYTVAWNTATASNGSHTLTAVARDAAGNSTTSAAVTVTVSNGSADTTPPVVSITSPPNGTTLSGLTTVSANATDNVDVVGVQFKLDGANLGSEQIFPFVLVWDTATAPNGTHLLTAVARDAAGNSTTSKTVTVTLVNLSSDVTPPTVSITAPANGVTVFGLTTVTAAAADDVGVVGVQFKLDGAIIAGEVPAAPYSIVWNTTSASNGQHMLTAVARDAVGHVTTSAAVTIMISNVGPTTTFNIPANGGISFVTAADMMSSSITVSHARIQLNPSTALTAEDPSSFAFADTGAVGAALAGVAIIGQSLPDGTLISETGVPAAPEIMSGRTYAEINTNVNTGVAISNLTGQNATIAFYFTDASGKDFGFGSIPLPAFHQIAGFLNQSMFGQPSGIQGNFQGTFTFNSDVPVGVIALRMVVNERSESLFTAVPVAQVGVSPNATLLPEFVDGAGWTTSILLTNASDSLETGNIQFFGQGSGSTPAPLLTMTVKGQTGTTFNYSIPAHSSTRFDTSGTGVLQVGSVRVTAVAPTPFTADDVPSAVSLFQLRMNGITVSQTSVIGAPVGQNFRLYMEASGTNMQPGSIRTGVALVNTSSSAISVTFGLNRLDGTVAGLPLPTTVNVPPGGEISQFLTDLFPTLPLPFQGVATLTATTPVAVAALRGRYNQRDEFLMTTTPPLNQGLPNPSSLVFPHIVNGQGYSTQVLVIGSSGNATLSLVGQDGSLRQGASVK